MKIEFPDKHTIESLVPKDFKFSLRLDVRWEDVDMYQHINNAKYYSFFDTTVNTNLVNQGLLDPEEGGAVFYVVENRCQFLVPIPFPSQIEVGLRTENLGRSSITYGLAVFAANQTSPAAFAHYTHVYVDRKTNRPTEIPPQLREYLESLKPY